jgi:hypothetical protein
MTLGEFLKILAPSGRPADAARTLERLMGRAIGRRAVAPDDGDEPSTAAGDTPRTQF